MATSSSRKHFIEHGYFRTYDIASLVEEVATTPFAHLRSYLQHFTDHDEILGYLQPWSKVSALHRFVRTIADSIFESDLDGPNLMVFDPDEFHVRRTLPVDAAFRRYEIDSDPFFPSTRDHYGRLLDDGSDIDGDDDEYYDYFQDLRLSQEYHTLLERLSDEVFFVMFMNRGALARLHKYLAMKVSELSPENLQRESPELASLFQGEGRLKRKAIPRWAAKAIFFRDHGRCVECNTDLSGLTDVLIRPAHYDHIVPLAEGGLNDVTNLQLLCEAHNLSKGVLDRGASRMYRRWYDA
jgi:5-methylcytosine-specific restriction endonuclease McrA